MKFRDLRRVLAEFGIVWNERRGKGSHGVFEGLTKTTRIRHVFVLPRSAQRDVHPPYLRALRTTFELTAEHGVPDELFR